MTAGTVPPSASPRVVSLVPSSTETLLALGADVVACTRFCEQPDLPHVGGTKNPDVDLIVSLAPDVVVLDREENRREDHDALVAAGIAVFVSDVRTVTDAIDVVAQLRRFAGPAASDAGDDRHDESGSGDGDADDGDVDVAASTVALPGPVPFDGRHAVVPIWRRPWMAIGPGTYGGSVLAHLGIQVWPGGDDPYPTLDLARVDAEVDLVVVPSEPYVFRDEHLDELRSAFPGAEVVRVDGQDLFWWGVRTPAAISRLGAALGLPPTA